MLEAVTSRKVVASAAAAALGLAPALASAAEGGVAPDDTRVEVMIWTAVGVAGGMLIGLLGYLVRLATGRVPPPPEQPAPHEGHH